MQSTSPQLSTLGDSLPLPSPPLALIRSPARSTLLNPTVHLDQVQPLTPLITSRGTTRCCRFSSGLAGSPHPPRASRLHPASDVQHKAPSSHSQASTLEHLQTSPQSLRTPSSLAPTSPFGSRLTPTQHDVPQQLQLYNCVPVRPRLHAHHPVQAVPFVTRPAAGPGGTLLNGDTLPRVPRATAFFTAAYQAHPPRAPDFPTAVLAPSLASPAAASAPRCAWKTPDLRPPQKCLPGAGAGGRAATRIHQKKRGPRPLPPSPSPFPIPSPLPHSSFAA